MRLGEMLRLYIVVHNIEQKTLARQLGMSESSLTRLLKGSGVDAQTFTAIMAWLVAPSEEAEK